MEISRSRHMIWSAFVISLLCLLVVQMRTAYRFRRFQNKKNDGSFVNDASDDFIMHVAELDGMTESLRQLLRAAVGSPRVHSTDIEEDTKARCERYGYSFSNQPKRRIFWGSLIADDSWHVLGIAAMEYHGLLDTIAFVESNTTQSGFRRTMRFPEGSPRKELLTSSSLWGETTRVHVGYFYSDNATFYKQKELWRENDQRDQIFQQWKKNGMTFKDIGFISDIDEIATRDFLLALQTCDVPEFFPSPSDSLPADRPHDCIIAKVVTSTIIFEGSPKCIQYPRRWYHPDFVVGECLEGIGEPRPSVPRELEYTLNMRVSNWTDYVGQITFRNTTIPMGPLWDATDVRMLGGTYRQVQGTTSHGQANSLNTAYHFHNFFDSLHTLRWKYLTYGHPSSKAMNVSLGTLNEGDVGLMVDCLSDRSTPGQEWEEAREFNLSMLDPLWGTPIAFQLVPGYMHRRHEELQKELAEDERLHPPDLINASSSPPRRLENK